jgi:uncharacterized membrane protein YdjX (TVP38/TMEM64 family)
MLAPSLPVHALPALPVPRARLLVAVAVLAALAAAWNFTPLGEYVTFERFVALGARTRELPAAPLAVVGAFVLGGLLVVPLTLMVVATTVVFGPLQGAAYALAGALTSALAGYGIGRAIGREALGPHAGRALAALESRVADGGALSVATLRLLPIAPFTVVNVLAGAAQIRVPSYLAGSVIAFVPGISAIAFATDRVGAALARPDAATIGILVAVVAVMLVAALLLRRQLARDAGAEAGRR